MEESMLMGDLCRQTDSTPRTVRFYEAGKMIAPIFAMVKGRKWLHEAAVPYTKPRSIDVNGG